MTEWPENQKFAYFHEAFLRHVAKNIGVKVRNELNKEHDAQPRSLAGVQQSSPAWGIQIDHWLRGQKGFNFMEQLAWS